MKHSLKISVAQEPGDGIVSCHHITVREKILRLLFGEKRRLTVIIPGNSVKTLSIEEEGGEEDEQNAPAV